MYPPGTFSAILGHFGPFWDILAKLSILVIFGHFWSFLDICTWDSLRTILDMYNLHKSARTHGENFSAHMSDNVHAHKTFWCASPETFRRHNSRTQTLRTHWQKLLHDKFAQNSPRTLLHILCVCTILHILCVHIFCTFLCAQFRHNSARTFLHNSAQNVFLQCTNFLLLTFTFLFVFYFFYDFIVLSKLATAVRATAEGDEWGDGTRVRTGVLWHSTNAQKKGCKGSIYIYIRIWAGWAGGARKNVYSWMDGGTHLRMMSEIYNLN